MPTWLPLKQLRDSHISIDLLRYYIRYIEKTEWNIQRPRCERLLCEDSMLWNGRIGGYECSRMEKKRRHFEENEINDGESPLADTPAGPSGVFINSSRIQLVGLFVRRFSLTPPSYRSFTDSVPLSRPVMYVISFFHPLSASFAFSFLKRTDYDIFYYYLCLL